MTDRKRPDPIPMTPFRTDICVPLIFALAMAGCTTTVSQEFRRSPDAVVEAAYIATDADFGNYDRLTGADMGIFFPNGSSIPADDLDRIRTIFRTAFLDELGPYPVVAESGPGILLVDASLIDLRTAGYGDIPNLRREIQDIARPGSLVFLMELKDSESGRVLARAADSSQNPKFSNDRLSDSEWQEVETAAQYWARLFRNFLDQNLNR